MGKFRQGINGPFSGKVGAVVGSTWMGMPVMRSRPSPRTKPFSPRELQQQAKFAMLSKFLRPLIPLLNQTFRPVAVRMTGFNKAFSYNVKNTITGVHPSLAIDYSMVLLGRGDLPQAVSPAATSPIAGKLDFTWTDNSGKGRTLPTDKAFAAAYNEEMDRWIYGMNLADRSAGTCSLDLKVFIGKPVHTYMGFISADGKDVSDSVYTGLVSV